MLSQTEFSIVQIRAPSYKMTPKFYARAAAGERRRTNERKKENTTNPVAKAAPKRGATTMNSEEHANSERQTKYARKTAQATYTHSYYRAPPPPMNTIILCAFMFEFYRTIYPSTVSELYKINGPFSFKILTDSVFSEQDALQTAKHIAVRPPTSKREPSYRYLHDDTDPRRKVHNDRGPVTNNGKTWFRPIARIRLCLLTSLSISIYNYVQIALSNNFEIPRRSSRGRCANHLDLMTKNEAIHTRTATPQVNNPPTTTCKPGTWPNLATLLKTRSGSAFGVRKLLAACHALLHPGQPP